MGEIAGMFWEMAVLAALICMMFNFFRPIQVSWSEQIRLFLKLPTEAQVGYQLMAVATS